MSSPPVLPTWRQRESTTSDTDAHHVHLEIHARRDAYGDDNEEFALALVASLSSYRLDLRHVVSVDCTNIVWQPGKDQRYQAIKPHLTAIADALTAASAGSDARGGKAWTVCHDACRHIQRASRCSTHKKRHNTRTPLKRPGSASLATTNSTPTKVNRTNAPTRHATASPHAGAATAMSTTSGASPWAPPHPSVEPASPVGDRQSRLKHFLDGFHKRGGWELVSLEEIAQREVAVNASCADVVVSVVLGTPNRERKGLNLGFRTPSASNSGMTRLSSSVLGSVLGRGDLHSGVAPRRRFCVEAASKQRIRLE
jgi:hypothetical protein